MFFQHCAKCGKLSLYVAKRSILVEKVDGKPITTQNEICGKCARKLKRFIKNNIK